MKVRATNMSKYTLSINKDFDSKAEVAVYLENIIRELGQSDFNAGGGWELENNDA